MVVLLHTFPNILISTPWSTKHARGFQKQDGFVLHDSLIFLYFWINIFQIFTISTIRTKFWALHLKRYVTTYFQIRSWIILSMFFGYLLGLYFLSSCMWQLSTYFEKGGGVGLYCKLVPDWTKSTLARILFLAQYTTRFEILPGEVFLKYHRLLRQTASLYFDSLIATAYKVFVTRVFPILYHPISQTSSAQITCWTHCLHHFPSEELIMDEDRRDGHIWSGEGVEYWHLYSKEGSCWRLW